MHIILDAPVVCGRARTDENTWSMSVQYTRIHRPAWVFTGFGFRWFSEQWCDLRSDAHFLLSVGCRRFSSASVLVRTRFSGSVHTCPWRWQWLLIHTRVRQYWQRNWFDGEAVCVLFYLYWTGGGGEEGGTKKLDEYLWTGKERQK